MRGLAVLVVVPTYNERATMREVAQRLFDASGDVELLVVDDSSPDGTAEVVSELDDPRVHLLRRPGKQGLGSAYVEGFGWAAAHGYEIVVEMDADLSHDPAEVPRLLEALERADVVIGSRYVPGGAIPRWGPLRRLLSRAGNAYARWWLRLPVRDATSGLRAYRARVLADAGLDGIRSEGYAFQIEMTRRAASLGAAIAEIPITFTERAGGRSKMSRRIVVEALWRVTWWGLVDRVRRAGR